MNIQFYSISDFKKKVDELNNKKYTTDQVGQRIVFLSSSFFLFSSSFFLLFFFFLLPEMRVDEMMAMRMINWIFFRFLIPLQFTGIE